jgi:hypothetical protein
MIAPTSFWRKLGEPLITGDERLYHVVRDQLDWVEWVEEYGSL